ncbi:MAG: hypothetical protein Q4F79_04375 [Eubacteriales bacterium]|nr:hypothetical protein [Eubacteriales bacterium]
MKFINIARIDDAIGALKDVYSALSGSMIGVIVLLVLGLLFCFLGFRLTRFVSAIAGAVLGGGLCAFVASSYLPESIASIGTVAAGVIGALLVAYLFYHISYAVVFVICAAAGGALGSVPALAVGSGSAIFYVIIAACAILFGAAGILFFKPVMIILTGLGGIVAAPQIFSLAGMETSMTIKLLAGIVLSVLGMLIQFLTTRGRTKPGFRKAKAGKEEAPQGEDGDVTEPVDDATRPLNTVAADIQYEEIDETPEAPRMVADDLNDAMRRKGFVRFLMAIAPILMLLSAVAVIVFQSAHVEVVVIFAFLCYAARRYKLLSITFLAMFGYTLYSCFPPLVDQNLPEFALSALSCLMFLVLTTSMLRMDRKSHPKKRIRRVPVEQAADSLEETRPLNADEVADVMQETQTDGEMTELMGTRSLEDDDTKTFAAGVPEDFRQTQEAIFGSAAFHEDDDMAAEPDAAVDLNSVAEDVDEALGDTRTI